MQGGAGYNSLCSYEIPDPGQAAAVLLQDYSESDNNDAFGVIYATSAVPYSFTYNLYDNDSSIESGVEYFGSTAVAYRSATESQSAIGSTGAAAGGSGGGCFIATAAFGSYQERHVRILRQFRDTFLLTNIPGKALVEWYYRHSPKYAAMITGSPGLRAMARTALLPVYGVAVLSLSGFPVPMILIIPCAGLSYLLCGGRWKRRSPKVMGKGGATQRK